MAAAFPRLSRGRETEMKTKIWDSGKRAMFWLIVLEGIFLREFVPTEDILWGVVRVYFFPFFVPSFVCSTERQSN